MVIGSMYGIFTVTFAYMKTITCWWLNQPIWKICSSKWVQLPQGIGVKIPKNIWNRHLDGYIPKDDEFYAQNNYIPESQMGPLVLIGSVLNVDANFKNDPVTIPSKNFFQLISVFLVLQNRCHILKQNDLESMQRSKSYGKSQMHTIFSLPTQLFASITEGSAWRTNWQNVYLSVDNSLPSSITAKLISSALGLFSE